MLHLTPMSGPQLCRATREMANALFPATRDSVRKSVASCGRVGGHRQGVYVLGRCKLWQFASKASTYLHLERLESPADYVRSINHQIAVFYPLCGVRTAYEVPVSRLSYGEKLVTA